MLKGIVAGAGNFFFFFFFFNCSRDVASSMPEATSASLLSKHPCMPLSKSEMRPLLWPSDIAFLRACAMVNPSFASSSNLSLAVVAQAIVPVLERFFGDMLQEVAATPTCPNQAWLNKSHERVHDSPVN